MQRFYLKNNLKYILFEDNLNTKPVNDIVSIIKNKLLAENLKIEDRYIIEGSMGDYIIWKNKNIELVGYCD